MRSLTLSVFAVLCFFMDSTSYSKPSEKDFDRCRKDERAITVAVSTALLSGSVSEMLTFIFGQQVVSPLYHTLFTTDVHFRISSKVLSGWTATNDNKAYRFDLKEGLTFANGNRITTQDLVPIFSPQVKSPFGSSFTKSLVSKVNIRSDREIEVVLNRRFPRFPELLSDASSIIVPVDEVEKPFPSSSGKFEFCARSESELRIQTRSKVSDPTRVSQIRYIAAENEPLTIEEINRRKIDIFRAPDSLIESTTSRFSVFRFLYPRVIAVGFNLKDRSLRKALASCLDVKEFRKHPHLSTGTVPQQFLLPRGFSKFSPEEPAQVSCAKYSGPGKPRVNFLSFQGESGSHEFMKEIARGWR